MAIYDLNSGSPTKVKKGDILNCAYSGTYRTITLPKGQYKLEVWGAQGGTYSTYYGGRGGYSEGILTLTSNTTLYLYSGGQPAPNSNTGSSNNGPGGWNGGGSATAHAYSGTATYSQPGGGGSDIRIGSTSLYSRVIVAGGGAGSANNDMSVVGAGGGTEGLSPGGTTYTGKATSAGSGGNFGIGGTANGSYIYKYGSPAGGGGWYGGGTSTGVSDSSSSYRNYGGGGSGYIYTSSTASQYPSGCTLNSNYYLTSARTVAGNTSFPAPGGGNETGHTGHGYTRITVLSGGEAIYKKINGHWYDITDSMNGKSFNFAIAPTFRFDINTTAYDGERNTHWNKKIGVIEGLSEENGFIMMENNGEKVNLTLGKDIQVKSSDIILPTKYYARRLGDEVLLLLHGNELKDDSNYERTLSNNGGVTFETFNGSLNDKVMHFNGSSRIDLPIGDYFDFGDGDFTIEWREYLSANINTANPFSFAPSNPHFLFHYVNPNVLLYYTTSYSGTVMDTQILNKWVHRAFVRSNGVLYQFRDGQQTWTGAITQPSYYLEGYQMCIGGRSDTPQFFNGYMEEFQVSNIAKWTSNFTPPTEPY